MSIIQKNAIHDIPKGLGSTLTNFLRSVKNRLETVQAAELPVYTAEQLNATTARSHSGVLVRCSNGDVGDECLAFCDGFKWRVVELGSKVSST